MKEWIFRGKERGYFCPHCGSRCLCDPCGDWFMSEYCPHCGEKVDIPPQPAIGQLYSPVPLPYHAPEPPRGGWMLGR